MKIFTSIFILVLVLTSCTGDKKDDTEQSPKKVAQWINPAFYNNDFETEFNFPLWFDDSLVKAHNIYKITKRIFPRISGDTSEINSYKQAIPKEKIEYYFDPNGLVDQIVVYMYFDDREISRATFVYEGNMHASGYRNIKMSPIMYIKKDNIKDQFSTEIYNESKTPFTLLKQISRKYKYESFMDVENRTSQYIVKNKKYWGPLSIDSIIHPLPDDWIVLGTMRKPKKRYQVENIVNEKNVFEYKYYKTGVLKRRIETKYPFEYHRTFQYGKNHAWKSYIDSVFSNRKFITKIENNILFDEYDRPVEIQHHKINESEEGYFYRETLHYRSKIK